MEFFNVALTVVAIVGGGILLLAVSCDLVAEYWRNK
jgi:hypothetical protein